MAPYVIQCDAETVIAPVNGTWECAFQGVRRRVDASVIVVGERGARIVLRGGEPAVSCRILQFAPGAIHSAFPLFRRRFVPAGSAVRRFLEAQGASNVDTFDSAAFAILDEASAASLRPRNRSMELRASRIRRFIHAHAFEAISLADLSKELGLSPFAVIRQFKAVTGMTPHAYLLDVRLDAAKRLLVGTTRSVEAIAKCVGFDDSRYFARFFKQRTGVTPTAFRAA